MCLVFGGSSLFVWLYRKCECAAGNSSKGVYTPKTLYQFIKRPLQSRIFWISDSLTSVHFMFWIIIQTWSHWKIFQICFLQASRSQVECWLEFREIRRAQKISLPSYRNPAISIISMQLIFNRLIYITLHTNWWIRSVSCAVFLPFLIRSEFHEKSSLYYQ